MENGPLGTMMGMSRKSFRELDSIDGNKYISSFAPKPSSIFASYVYEFATNGLCWVKGIGHTVNDNGYGGIIQQQFEKI